MENLLVAFLFVGVLATPAYAGQTADASACRGLRNALEIEAKARPESETIHSMDYYRGISTKVEADLKKLKDIDIYFSPLKKLWATYGFCPVGTEDFSGSCMREKEIKSKTDYLIFDKVAVDSKSDIFIAEIGLTHVNPYFPNGDPRPEYDEAIDVSVSIAQPDPKDLLLQWKDKGYFRDEGQTLDQKLARQGCPRSTSEIYQTNTTTTSNTADQP